MLKMDFFQNETTRTMSLGFLTLAWTLALASQTPALIVSTWSFFKKRFYAWLYLVRGPLIIKSGFDLSGGKPYEIHAPDKRMVFVSSPKHIKELDKCPDDVLSLNGAAKHMLQPVYTMNGFNWFDKRGVEGVGFVRTLRTLLTNNIPKLLPELRKLTQTQFTKSLTRYDQFNGETNASIYPIILDMVVLLNARSLFGAELIQDEKFMVSALGYVEETLLNAEIVKLLPTWLAPTVGKVLSSFMSHHKRFFKSLVPMTEQRVEERQLKALGREVPQRADCIQWIIETAPRQNPWSAERVIYELMAIWFGSVHILSTTIVYIIHDLCLHPEYVEPLRRELDECYEAFEHTGQGLPLLDSFIKESCRLTPVESMSVRRSALRPFTLSDGTHLNVGDWACAPSGAINLSAEHYPTPDEFSGFRFAKPEDFSVLQDRGSGNGSTFGAKAQQTKPSKLTDVDHSFLMWGTGRMACPGRFYASAFMKVIIAHLLMSYDFSLVDPRASRWISWRVARIPKPWTKVKFSKRSPSNAPTLIR